MTFGLQIVQRVCSGYTTSFCNINWIFVQDSEFISKTECSPVSQKWLVCSGFTIFICQKVKHPYLIFICCILNTSSLSLVLLFTIVALIRDPSVVLFSPLTSGNISLLTYLDFWLVMFGLITICWSGGLIRLSIDQVPPMELPHKPVPVPTVNSWAHKSIDDGTNLKETASSQALHLHLLSQ